jgi:hypothetical protein
VGEKLQVALVVLQLEERMIPLPARHLQEQNQDLQSCHKQSPQKRLV